VTQDEEGMSVNNLLCARAAPLWFTDAIDIHASISALTFFNVSNQHTFGLIFKHDPAADAARVLRRSNIVEMIVRFVIR
jgi:hypothetical protein